MRAPLGHTRTVSSLPCASVPTCTELTSAMSICARRSSDTSSRKPGLAVAEVERVEPLLGFALAARDGVERLFHRGGEVVVDEVREVTFEQLHLRERLPRGDERGALLEHVVAGEDRLDHRHVGGRSTDAALFELLHQRRFGEARRRLRGVTGGTQLRAAHGLPLLERRAATSRGLRARPRGRRHLRRRRGGSRRTRSCDRSSGTSPLRPRSTWRRASR